MPSISVLNLLRSRNLDNTNYYQASAVLFKLNNTFQMTQRNDKYFTMWHGVFNIKIKKLIYSSAGHPPAILINESECNQLQSVKLKARGTPIGMFANMVYQDLEYQLNSSSAKLYLFSDGICELNQADGSLWGLDNFEKLLLAQPNLDLEYIVKEVKKQNTLSYLNDDISIMEIKLKERKINYNEWSKIF